MEKILLVVLLLEGVAALLAIVHYGMALLDRRTDRKERKKEKNELR